MTPLLSVQDPSLRPHMRAWPITGQALEPISYFQFDETGSAWSQVTAQLPPKTDPKTEGIRIVSYNVLSSPLLNSWTCEVLRWTYILDVVLSQANADVYMLNEVSETFWKMALERPWVRSGYYVTEYHTNNGPRNNMIISRYPMQQLYRETKNERRSYVAKIEPAAGAPLWIVAAHIHAQFPGRLIRRAQLDAMYSYLSQTCGDDPVLIMGDLNFHSEEENVNILPPFFDVYRNLYPVPEDPATPWNEQQLGITFDVPNNAMVLPMGAAFSHRMRLDRALLRQSTSTSGASFIPRSMEIFAKDPLSPDTPDLLPSDHYALKLEMDISRTSN